MNVRPAAHIPAADLTLASPKSSSILAWPLLAMAYAPAMVLLVAPVPLFLLTLATMLFRPPGVEAFPIDRVAFVILLINLLLRAFVTGQAFHFAHGFAWPMLGLTFLATLNALAHPWETTTWSVLAAKFVVPFALFWLAPLVFEDEQALRWLERFCLLVLAYLIFIAVAFLAGVHEAVLPRFILDEAVGIHADRARGPFLQAVANGIALNFLGLLAINAYRRGRLRGMAAALLLAMLPVAILATRTRAVWLSFTVSLLLLIFRSRHCGFRKSAWVVSGAVVALAIIALWRGNRPFQDRLTENGSVEFRMAVYQAGWGMFLERPLAGWGTQELQNEIAARLKAFRGQSFAVHNTYLEVLLEHGIVGFALYLWLMLALWRLRKHRARENRMIASLRRLWPLLLGVYLVNASFVVMNYLFVNALVFTYAGILAADTVQANSSVPTDEP